MPIWRYRQFVERTSSLPDTSGTCSGQGRVSGRLTLEQEQCMNGHNLVAVYNLREDAERVRNRLVAFGIPATDIRLSSASENASSAAVTDPLPQERHHSFWDWPFGNDVPEHDRTWYHTNLREGRT